MTNQANQLICKCKRVTLFDIEDALRQKQTLSDVEKEFEHVQKVTHCSTGCGSCHNKILDIISEYISG